MMDRNMRENARKASRSILMRSVSTAAIVAIASIASPAQAQLVARRSPAVTAPTIAPRAVPGQIRSAAATGGLARQTATRTRAEQIRTFATEARAAAARSVPNGLAGLVIARGVNAQALAAGALAAARDSTGRATWQGAALPTETVTGGNSLVTINQTESRAILSWDRFDVGAQTTLQFNQKLNGVAQKDWVAVNRVVDPAAAPSQILGSIVADGTVVVINRNGMIFGSGAKVNTNALLASSLDIGNFVKAGTAQLVNPVNGNLETVSGFTATTLQDRNLAFLQNGLLQSAVTQGGLSVPGMLVSAEAEGFATANQNNVNGLLANSAAGAVSVERGASLTAGKGGFVILTAPTITNDGSLSAAEGQVSLQAGRSVSYVVSTGAAPVSGDQGGKSDPNIRGLILRTPYDVTGAAILNTGLIEAPRGYVSLGTSLKGSVTNAGLLAATTSVSRNGNIALTGGRITLSGSANPSQAGGIVILPDDNGETIPQGSASSPANFKTSQITIGGIYLDFKTFSSTGVVGELGPASISLGANSLIHAPSATVKIGGESGQAYSNARYENAEIPDAIAALAASRIDVGDGALIDVSGVKDLSVASSRNSLLIDPVKRNELRDTPNYRETSTSGAFTLNGAAVYVDPRISGVRGDGVAYVGSPLIEAGSAASQIGITAAEFMTKGGALNLTVATLDLPTAFDAAPKVTVAASAAIDFSGGWVSYQEGIVRSSRLLTEDGRVVDIGQADPNDRFVAVGDGFNEVQAKFGISRVYANSILQGARYEQGYDEGRDAGALIVNASAAALDGTLYGQAFAGVRQLSSASHGTKTSAIAGDLRKLQGAATDLPSGGYLSVGVTGNVLGADIVVGDAAAPAPVGAIRLDDAQLSAAGLSALALRTSAGVTFAEGSNLTLANGGTLGVEAGRAVRLDGNVTATSGAIKVTTFDQNGVPGFSAGSFGSAFRDEDDIQRQYAADPGLSPFDITVTGKLSTAGLWTNDFTGTSFTGKGWIDGGSISLTVAPSVFVALTGSRNAADLSGSIRIAPEALLDVSSGGYVSAAGAFDFGAKGGDVSLINRTVYASRTLTDTTNQNSTAADEPLGGRNQTVNFTGYTVGEANVVSALTVAEARSEVAFGAESIRGFGFDGGGTFELVAPDIVMGSRTDGKGPRVGLDFLQKTGFGTLSLTAVKSRIVENFFDNTGDDDDQNDGNSAFLMTERFVVGSGETLDLTQTVLPQFLTDSIANARFRNALTQQATGTDILAATYADDNSRIVAPFTPDATTPLWDRKAAHLVLGGITELDIEAGGSLVGAPGASITMPRLYNAGRIAIAGGSIVQKDTMQLLFTQQRAVGVRDTDLGGGGFSDVLGGGVAGQENGFDEDALVKIDVFRDGNNRVTNGQLFSYVNPTGTGPSTDVNLVFTGRVALNEGIHLAAGSTVDLSGTAIYDPRAVFLPSGRQLRSGRMVAGGSITTERFGSATAASGYASPIDPSNRLVAEAGSTIRLDGASGVFDERVSLTRIAPVAQWSDGGRLVVGNGAQLTGATVSARGGGDGDADLTKTRATGGLLDWVAPVIRQTDDGSGTDGSVLFADQIMAAGFDSLTARNGFTVQGAVDLTLGKSFIATTDTIEGVRTATPLTITAAPGSAASITAPYIRLASSNRTLSQFIDGTEPGSISLTAQAMDIVGTVGFNVGDPSKGGARGRVRLAAAGDIRLIGTAGIANATTGLFDPGLTGALVSNGDLFFQAGQVYATTGTGNLQDLLEKRRAGAVYTPTPYVVASTNAAGIVRFEGQNGAIPDTPLSAGSYLRVLGANIVQNGVLRAPLGLLEIGSNDSVRIGGSTAPVTQSLSFGSASFTSVSARVRPTGTAALDIPYGTTTDLIEYFFNPGSTAVLSTMPMGELRLAGKDIFIADGGNGLRIDGRGGGDVFAYEFIPGTGGSRDILDRFNPDLFSGNNGLQFPDGRQVYAIVPKTSATAALFDPIYSADYAGGGGVDLYGADAGLSVRLDGAPGIPAGDYLLLPAHYATLPGAMRIVENVGDAAPYVDGATQLLDGSIVVGGVFTTAGTGKAQSQRRSFTVQSQDVIAKYSRIETTSGSENVTDLAEHKGVSIPALPRDAARVVLSPLTSLKVAGAFATDAAAGGLGSRVDLGGKEIRIVSSETMTREESGNGDPATAGFLKLTADTLSRFNANSLSIGALRTDQADGTTALDVIAKTILIDSDVQLSAPELLFAVGGPGSLLQIKDAPRGQATGASIVATGTLVDQRSGDYVIKAPNAGVGGDVDQTGVGAVLRVSTGPERLVLREGDAAVRNTLQPSRLDIGAGAQIRGSAITLDSSRTFQIDRTAQIGAATANGAFTLALSSDGLRLGGLNFRPEIEAQFGQASRLTLRSPDTIFFAPSTYRFNDLTIDAPGIGLAQPFQPSWQTNDVILIADDVVLRNSGKEGAACRDTGAAFCSAFSSFLLDASTITFGDGTVRTYGFDAGLRGEGVTLSARNGMFVSGKGSFSTVNTDATNEVPLNLITPFIVDRTRQDVRSAGYVRPDYSFVTNGALTVKGTGGAAAPAAGNEAPGARIAFVTGNAFNGIPADITIDNALVRATAGTIDATAYGSILLTGTTSLQTPGYTKTFDDGIDKTTVSASGGVINLISTGLGTTIDAGATTSLVVDNGLGKAGALNIAASQGEVHLAAQLNAGIAANADRAASLRLDTGSAAFDLAGFVTAYGRRFQGDLAIRSGVGDLSLAAGQRILADSVSLVADGGKLLIAGTIDTSGDDVSSLKVTDAAYREARVDGGAIALFGREGVALAGTAALVSTTGGYNAVDTRQASGGKVTIGIGVPESSETPPAALTIASGAVIDVSAKRPGDRFIEKLITDPVTQLEFTAFHMAPGDQGGLVSFRAPVLADDTVNFVNRGRIDGARELSVEGYRRFDLDAIAASDAFSGLTVRNINGFDHVMLDPGASVAGKANFLADIAAGTLPDFIRNFRITGPDGEVLSGYRLRPGVELASANAIQLQADWNLGAGQITDIDGAVSQGLLVESTLGTFTKGALAGQKAYEVVYGKEGTLFENFVDMLYRVDGSVRGEAPVLTFRAAGDLKIANSITDGFFTFHDRTNADYINYQLGGGDRTYNPALVINCGAGDAASCTDSIPFSQAPGGAVTGSAGNRITINIGAAQQGTETSPFFIAAPYNPLANAAAPTATGDALGVAELFPLLGDGSAVHSTSLQLVAGANLASANPLQTDSTQVSSVSISGEKSYRIAAERGAASLAGTLQLGLGAAADRQFYGLGELLDLIDSGTSSDLDADYYTVLSWGAGQDGASAAAREAALAYFQGADFTGSRAVPTGVKARLRDVVAFLIESGFAENYAQGVEAGLPGYNTAAGLATNVVQLRNPTAYVGTTVRTGDGSIDVAAAVDISLLRGGLTLRGDANNTGTRLQVGGTSLYTAGVRASAADLRGAAVPSDAGLFDRLIPGATSGLAAAPVFAKDGGSIALTAGRDIIGRRDVWSEQYGNQGTTMLGTTTRILADRNYGDTTASMVNLNALGSNALDQRWRYGETSFDNTMASIAFNYFTSGVGALSGGDVSIRAGRDISDMTVALNNSLVTGQVDGRQTLVKLGGGNLAVSTGRNLVGGQFDIASGLATVNVGGSVVAAAPAGEGSFERIDENLLRVRVSDAMFSLSAKGNARIGGVGALGVSGGENEGLGFYSALSGFSIAAIESVQIIGNRPGQFVEDGDIKLGYVLPPSLSLTSIAGAVGFLDFEKAVGDTPLARPRVMYGSEYGQLQLLSAESIEGLTLAMSDVTPVNMFGKTDINMLRFPAFYSDTSDADLRQQHDRRILHRDDFEPVRIITEGSINDVILSLPKAARIRAGQDIVDLVFQGQHLRSTDVTRISAGRDITGTVGLATGDLAGRSGVRGNNIVLGGPGALFVEAGRDLGPFITSATGSARTEAGGIRTIGNEANPWLGEQGADLYVMFGVGQGGDYAALERVYLDPANLSQLDGDLFEQNEDAFGNKSPDRSRFSYAPVLAEWLRDNRPEAFAAVFGAAPPSGDALTQQAYARYGDLYQAFAGLDQISRNRFLLDKLYFSELAAPSDPNSQSFNQYVRGYRAVQTLFSPERGFTDNLATYVTDPATINADHPLGVSTKRLVNGAPAVADVKLTGNVDLRLSTIQTARGGDVTILGPGGTFVAGSLVRTEAQIQRRVSAFNIVNEPDIADLQGGNFLADIRGRISAIPAGYEGILTLRGGEIRGFTDGNFTLNQSRLFTQAGGDITLWSSNGDLNAGQGPRSSSNFPPIVLRFSPNGFSEVNSAGSVAGAGIGAFKSSPSDPEATIRLIAPVGTVDAGDAGVRASGSIFVAAARVANADNFAAGGTISGVPSGTVAAAPAVPASAASAIVANAVRAATAVGDNADRLSRIFVDVLGYFGGGEQDCPQGQSPGADGQCRADTGR